MDAGDFALNIFQMELETSRDIDNRAKYLASGAAIFMGIIINSLLSNQIYFTASFPVVLTLAIFLVSFIVSLSVTMDYSLFIMPNDLFHKLSFLKNFSDINNLELSTLVEVFDTQCSLLYKMNVNKNQRLFISYVLFMCGIMSVIVSSSYISSNDGNLVLYLCIPCVIIILYLFSKMYRMLPKSD